MKLAVVSICAMAVALASEGFVHHPRADGIPPAFARGKGPLVVIDRGHHNHAIGSYRLPIERWLQEQGYRVREHAGPFDHESLGGAQILVIRNALSERNAFSGPATDAVVHRAWKLPTSSAFMEREIETLHDWVQRGGSLLWVFDHMPMPGAAQELAAAFGIEVSNGNAIDARALRTIDGKAVERAGRVVFSRAERSLADDPVTNGRGWSERIDSVASDGGSAFRLPSQARSLLTLGPSFVSLLPTVAWEFSEATPSENVAGWSQGGLLRVGAGRVAVFGDGSLLMTPEMAASLRSEKHISAGALPASFDENPKLLINVMHWLSGLLDES